MSIKIRESETRYSLIDPQLGQADWNLADHTAGWF